MGRHLFEGKCPERRNRWRNHSEGIGERSAPRHAQEDRSSHVEASIIANRLNHVAVLERAPCALEPETSPAGAFAISVRRMIATLVPAEGHLRIASVAEALGLRVRTLQRRLAEERSSFEELLQADRLGRASLLLETTRATILEIALALGYSDHPHFTRAFRRWRGVTPLAYRRSSMARRHARVHAPEQHIP
jgi:AraC-like DNA-binding protein